MHNPHKTPRLVQLPSLAETEALAQKLAPLLRTGDVLTLSGDLGAGKTTFSRALVRALGVTGDVPSPTFTILQTYEVVNNDRTLLIHHFDLYRITADNELDELGWEDALATGISFVEWPERAATRYPRHYLSLTFLHDNQGRRCTLVPFGEWETRVEKVVWL